jgi:hypothetical protein
VQRGTGDDEEQQHRPAGRDVVLTTDVEPVRRADTHRSVRTAEAEIEQEDGAGAEQQPARRAAQDGVSR